MKKFNYIYAACLLGIGTFANIYARRYELDDKNIQIGTEFFPVILSYCLIVVAVLLIIANIFGKTPDEDEPIGKRNIFKILIFITACAAFYVSLKSLGFIVAGALLVALCMYMMGCRKYIAIGIYSIAMPAAIFSLFYYALQVSLPTGILEFIIPKL